MARLPYDFYGGDTLETARKLLGKLLVRRLPPCAGTVPDRTCFPERDPAPDWKRVPDWERIPGTEAPADSARLYREGRILPDGSRLLAGRITETEGYIGRCDKACHAYGYRRTKRTDPLFQAPGHAYVYLIYGMYHCLNLVTEPEGEPAAVLIRSVECVAGESVMCRARYGENPITPARRKNLLNGPGKVCQALSVTLSENRADLTGDRIWLCDSPADLGLPDWEAWSAEAEAVFSGKSPSGFLPGWIARYHRGQTERICASPRIGVDYAEEARDYPWRFTLEPDAASV